MKPLTRDILFTLVAKFSLLIILWVVCFKSAEKPEKDVHQWLFGTGYLPDTKPAFSKK